MYWKTRFMIQARPRHQNEVMQTDEPLRGKEIGVLMNPIHINYSTPAGGLCSIQKTVGGKAFL